ncbi:MAG: transcriptional regulator with PAS, ATPase and Fis domain [Hyphomicrobiaceae bacterium]|jgi:transcriptional regulator with PAS, ATPase and Fis domain
MVARRKSLARDPHVTERPITTNRFLAATGHGCVRLRPVLIENRIVCRGDARRCRFATLMAVSALAPMPRIPPDGISRGLHEWIGLVVGETGTGKELVAREIHRRSNRAAKLIVPVHVAAIPSELLESELFGHEKGAFTGATESRPGLFEFADHGTLFLDEIGEAPMGLQSKLLRVLQDGIVRRVGSTRERAVDVRVVSATNRPLERMIEEKTFRSDLFYRIKVIQIRVPPLRERKEDIPLLIAHFVDEIAGRLGKGPMVASANALAAIARHDWPGNVRELRNAVERAVVMATDNVLTASLFEFASGEEETDSGQAPVSLTDMVDHFERDALELALGQSDGVKRRAAELLGVSERTLWYKLKKHGLS